MTVTSVPTIPTICVASLAPIVSVVVVSLVLIIIARPSIGPTSGGASALAFGVVNPTNIVPPPSSSIPTGWMYDQYMYAFQNPDLQNSFHYYDSRGAHIYDPGSIPFQPRLRFQFRYMFLGVVPVIMVAKHSLWIFKVHPIKVSHLMGNHIKGNLIQGSLLAHKDNPYRDNLWPSLIPLLLTLCSLLVNRVCLTSNEANLMPSKVTPLDKYVSLKSNNANILSSLINPLHKQTSLKSSKTNLLFS